MSYVAYIPLKDEKGVEGAISGIGPNIGAAIRDTANKLNTVVAGNGGYKADSEPQFLVAAYAVREGVQQVRHEVVDGVMTVYELNAAEEKGETIAPALVMHFNPLRVSAQFPV